MPIAIRLSSASCSGSGRLTDWIMKLSSARPIASNAGPISLAIACASSVWLAAMSRKGTPELPIAAARLASTVPSSCSSSSSTVTCARLPAISV